MSSNISSGGGSSSSSSSQLLHTLGHRLGINSTATLSKAGELQRRLSMRGLSSLSASAAAVICLQLAATLAGDACDKGACAKLSGLTAAKYRSQLLALGQLLDVNQRVTIHDLAIAHSALQAETLATDVLTRYAQQTYGIDMQLPLYQAAALAAAASHLKIKVDKKRLVESSGAAQRKLFDKLVERLVEVALQISKEKPSPVLDTAGKRTKTLMEIIEDNLATAAVQDDQQLKRKGAKDNSAATCNKLAKTDKQRQDQEYQDWKKKMLQEAEDDD